MQKCWRLEAKPVDQKSKNWKRENLTVDNRPSSWPAPRGKNRIGTHALRSSVVQFDAFLLDKHLFLVRDTGHWWSRTEGFPRHMTPQCWENTAIAWTQSFSTIADRHEKLYGRSRLYSQRPIYVNGIGCVLSLFSSLSKDISLTNSV